LVIGQKKADTRMRNEEQQRRLVSAADANFDEAGYLAANPDVQQAVRDGFFPSGRRHFEVFGRTESRKMFLPASGPKDSFARRLQRRLGGVPDSDPRIEVLEARTYDLEVATTQLKDVLAQSGVRLPPPKHLQQRVVGSYNGDFIRSGFTSVVPQLRRVLATVDRQLNDFDSILDFGCGCGRALNALHVLVPNAALFGTDIDGEAIGWLNDNWPDVASYSVSPPTPPMPHPDACFDFVFGISVMTHLPEDLHLKWLEELARVTRPGGYVMLTTHGEHVWRGQLTDEQLETLQEVGLVYATSGYGLKIGLPDFYETTYHSHEYIRRVWGRYFEVVGVWEPEPGEHQDSVLLRRPPATKARDQAETATATATASG
jgi:SAM-dependent methyltransferase